MIIGYFKEYKGYKGTIEYDAKDDLFYGRLIRIGDLVNYSTTYGIKDIIGLHEEFMNAVDNYIETKKSLNVNKK